MRPMRDELGKEIYNQGQGDGALGSNRKYNTVKEITRYT